MKKMSVLALAAFSLFALPAFANVEGEEEVTEETVSVVTEPTSTSEERVLFSSNDATSEEETEVQAESFLFANNSSSEEEASDVKENELTA